MKKINKKYKPFSNPKWNQQLGAEPTGETFELTEETKKWSEEQEEKWKKNLKKIKNKRKNTQK